MKLRGICKKEYCAGPSAYNYNYELRLQVGHIYEYESVANNMIMINNGNSVYFLYKNMNDDMFPNFSDYFYTEKELRTKKLNKLNGKI